MLKLISIVLLYIILHIIADNLLHIIYLYNLKKQPTLKKCRLLFLECYSAFISSVIFVVTLLTATDILSKILFTSSKSL